MAWLSCNQLVLQTVKLPSHDCLFHTISIQIDHSLTAELTIIDNRLLRNASKHSQVKAEEKGHLKVCTDLKKQ